VILLALLAGGCGSAGKDATTAPRRPAGSGEAAGRLVTLGTKNFTEQFVLGELYAQALRAKGFRVRLKRNIGPSELIDQTLTSGRIDLYAEYTGVVATVIAGRSRRLRSARQAYEAARSFEARRGFTMLAPTPFSDVLALAVKPARARRDRLRDIGDLRRLGAFSFGGAPENETRYQGLVGMRRAYGLTKARFVPVTLGDQYRALDSGRVDVANVLTTDGQLARGAYVVLRDPKRIFGFQNAAPVVNRRVLAAEGPAFRRTLDAVSARLTDRAMRAMNAAVDIDRRDAADVARTFLRAHGLL